MGSLTTFTVYNDGISALDQNKPENAENIRQFVTGVYEACLGIPRRSDKYSYPVGSYCNFLNVQDPRHADDWTLYIHMGNAVTEFNGYTERAKNLFRQHPDFSKKLLSFLKEQVKVLSKLEREIKDEA